MKLTNQQMKEAYNEATLGHHEPVGVILRLGGDKEDYQKLVSVLRGYSKL